MKHIKTKGLVMAAIMAAITAIFSQIVIPIAPVPINLAMLAVFIAGGLSRRVGFISQLVYIGLGVLGIPVFVGFNAGAGVLLGPTGGYIAGYVAAAAIVGIISKKTGYSYWGLSLGMAAGLAACYTIGTAWFMILTGTSLISALMLCVVPFLLGDSLKIVMAVLVVKRVHKVLF